MLRYRVLKLFLAFVVLSYLCSALTLKQFEKKEIFPVFTWDLFSKVPSRQTNEFALLITEIDGIKIEPPADLITSRRSFSKTGNRTSRKVIQRLGQAVLEKNEKEEEAIRSLLETEYLNDFKATCKYAIARRTFDPVQKFKAGGDTFELLKEYSIQKA